MDRLEWLQWRQKGIGSSDAPIIMGVSPYKTPFQLWEEKTSNEVTEDETNQFIKDQGNEAEGKIRAFYELVSGETFEVALCEMADYPFMRSSLDGRTKSKKIICEIKLLGDGGKDAKPEDMHFTNAKKGIVPPQYFPQIQEQLLVTGAEKCVFLAYLFDIEDRFLKNQMTHDRFVVVEVFPDLAYQETLLTECIKFWECVTTKKPPPFTDKDWKMLKGGATIAKKFKAAKLKIEKAEEELESHREALIALAKSNGHPRLEVSGLTMQLVPRKGNVDNGKVFGFYDQIVDKLVGHLDAIYTKYDVNMEDRAPMVIKPDPEKLRAKGTVNWVIK